MKEVIIIVIISAFPLFLAAIWVAVLKVLSTHSGWSRMAERYATGVKFTGKKYRFQSAHIGNLRINGSLTVGVSPTGLYLIPILPFRPFHRPLLIPWNEIQSEEIQLLGSVGHRLTLPSVPDAQLVFEDRLFNRIIKYLQKQMASQP